MQLYRLDLATGEIGQLTDGKTWDSGWAIWCEWHLRGIYNHLSAIHPRTDEVYYFEADEIRATQVATFANRLVAKLPPGRLSIGQSAFSPDGSLFGFIHVDAEAYVARLHERQVLETMGLFQWTRDHHHGFRNAVPTTLSVIETATGRMRTVIETDFHFHHVLFRRRQDDPPQSSARVRGDVDRRCRWRCDDASAARHRAGRTWRGGEPSGDHRARHLL